MRTALIYDPRFLEHQTADSPECPQRLTAILQSLQTHPSLWESLQKIPPRMADEEDILRCHTPALLNRIKTLTPTDERFVMLDPDTVISKASYDIARLAAGSTFNAIDAIFANQLDNAFALIRPPGHHATHAEAMGFCLFNNAAIAARYAQAHHGVKNILIIDWDVHHGNGTQDIFYDDDSVFYFSLHEFPFYPGTGAQTEIGSDAGTGTTLNIPLAAGTSAAMYRKAFQQGLQHIEKNFTPDLIIISAGFDSRAGDPLGELQLSHQDFTEMTHEVLAFAARTCGGKVISLLEGGYLNQTLGDAVCHHVEALAK